MNQLKITNLEFIDSLSTSESRSLTGGLDADVDTDVDADVGVLLSIGEPTLIIGRASGASAGAFAISLNGKASAFAFAQA